MELPRSFGSALTAQTALIIPTLTAAGSGDNTEYNGVSIDREDAHSCVFAVCARAVLTATKLLTLKATLQHSDVAANEGFADVAAALQPGGTADSVVMVLTGGAGGSTEHGTYKLVTDLSALKRYVRIQVHADLDHSGTDTAAVGVACMMNNVIESP
jgi:hypothetical protein